MQHLQDQGTYYQPSKWNKQAANDQDKIQGAMTLKEEL